MFYFKILVWLLISVLARFFFYLRLYFCKNLSYPILPINFYFEEFSIYWLYFLAFFYQEDNYLSRLPVSKQDVLKLKKFRKFVKLYPFDIVNFFKFNFLKKKVFFQNYNFFKNEFSIFEKWVDMSNIFIIFFGDSHNFLKFLFFRKYTLQNSFIFFYINVFYTPLRKNLKRKNLIHEDFILTRNVIFCKNKSYFNMTNQCDHINLFVIHEILNKEKKILPVNHNFYFKTHQYYLAKFKKLKKDKFIKVLKKYDAFWATACLELYNIYVVLNVDSILTSPFKKPNFLKSFPITINSAFNDFINLYWPVKHNSGLFSKFIDLNLNKNHTIFFLRKTRIFNKGRYSRNRQLYRTGVYMCLWINIIFVYFYIFAFYRFTFNFGFLWFGIGVFVLSMTFARAARYRFYNFKNFIVELYDLIFWSAFFLEDALKSLKTIALKWASIFKNSHKYQIFFFKE